MGECESHCEYENFKLYIQTMSLTVYQNVLVLYLKNFEEFVKHSDRLWKRIGFFQKKLYRSDRKLNFSKYRDINICITIFVI